MKTIELQAVGLYFRISPDDLSKLARKLPMPVRFEREPENRFDENAIKVITVPDNRHIGYLSRLVAAEYAPLIDEGKLKLVEGKLIDVEMQGGEATVRIKMKTAGN